MVKPGGITNFANQIEAMAEKKPDQKILTFEYGHDQPEVLTYQHIFKWGCKLAQLWQQNGIKVGDKVAVLMRNYPEIVYAFYAASALGVVLVPVDPRSKGEKLKFQINDADVKGILVAVDLLPALLEVLAETPHCKVLGVVDKSIHGDYKDDRFLNLKEIWAGPEVGPPHHKKTDPNIPLEIIYTSGTTGLPKGVTIKEDRLAVYALLGRAVWQYQADDILYTGLSLTHGNAQAVTLIPALTLGIPAVISHQFTKSRIWDICRQYGCTTFSLLGGMMMGIYSEPVKPNDADNPVRLVISAGTPAAIWTDFEKRFNVKIHEWYGAVEGGFAHNPPGVGPVGSFGKPIAGMMEMMVVDEQGQPCAPMQKGELICRMVQGATEVEYYGNQKASKEKTRGGWLRTGDICHSDQDGWFYFDFRVGGGLRRQGDFIAPDYVEKVIAQHPDVSDVCVYGLPAASGAPGESDLVAAVVPLPGHTINPGSIYEICLAQLERNAVPSYLQVVTEIPKTASEKNLERLLRDEFDPAADNIYPLA